MLTAHDSPKTRNCPPLLLSRKELAARASGVAEVTLDKNMLALATKFMNGKDKRGLDDTTERQNLFEGLDGIYVRSYAFDKEGEFTAEQTEQLRKYFETDEWTPMAQDHGRKSGEIRDVMVKLVNGE